MTIWPESCYDNDIEPIRPFASKGKEELRTLRNLLRSAAEPDDELSAVELLAKTPLDQIDQAIRTLRQRGAPDEIRRALVERIARAPLSDFQMLKTIYLTHCAEK